MKNAVFLPSPPVSMRPRMDVVVPRRGYVKYPRRRHVVNGRRWHVNHPWGRRRHVNHLRWWTVVDRTAAVNMHGTPC